MLKNNWNIKPLVERSLEEPEVNMLQWNNWLWLVVGSIFFLFATMIYAESVRAHDSMRPERNAWLSTLKADDGTWCCDGGDVVEDPEWQTRAAHYEVKIGGEWQQVPSERIVSGKNKIGVALLWPGGTDKVRCFMPGMAG